MSNGGLTPLIPTIYAALDVVSREMIGIIPAVNRNSGIERAAVGQSILVPAAPPVTATAIVPGVTPPNDGDQVFTNTAITIDQAYRVPVRWNGEEIRGLNSGPGTSALMAEQWAQAFRTLGNMVEASLVTKAVQSASRAAGTPGTAPFGTAGDFSDFANCHQILDDNGAPWADRQMVLGSSAISNLRGRQSILFKANEAGTDNLLRNGVLDRIEGFDLHNSYGVRPGMVVKGTGSGYVLGTGSYPIGTTSLPLATGTGTVNPGDAITLAGDTNRYMVTGVGISGPGTVTIGQPGLRVAHAAGDSVTLGGSYTPNLAFSASAIVLATRAPALPIDMNGQARDMATDRTTVTDPVSGISFEISEYLQYRQVQYEVALVWGSAVVKPSNVAVLQG